MSPRVVFWGNSQSAFSNRHLDTLLDVSCEVVAVVDLPPTRQGSTNPLPDGFPDAYAAARQRSMPVFSPADPNAPYFVAQMQTLVPDLFMAVGYALILKPSLLAVPRLLAANFHASLLPKYRGKHPVFWTLRCGEVWAGLTVHFMDPGIDTGDIIYQVKVRTRWDDSVASLYDRIMDRSVGLVGKLVSQTEEQAVPRQAQPDGLGSYFSSTTTEDFLINWRWPSEKIRRHIVMTPGKCFASMAGRRVNLSQAEKVHGWPESSPGTVLKLGRKRCTIATRDGAVSIGRGRTEGGQDQPLASLCRWLGIKVGDRLL